MSYQWMITRRSPWSPGLRRLDEARHCLAIAVVHHGGAALCRDHRGWNLCSRLGDLILLDPSKLYDQSLYLTEWEFKKDVVYFAGQHFANNQALANRKATLSRIMSLMFAVEVVALLIWLARNLATSAPWALELL